MMNQFQFIEDPGLLAPLIISGLAALLILLFRGKPNLREGVSVVAATATFITLLLLSSGVSQGTGRIFEIITIVPGLSFKLALDGPGCILGLVSSLLWIGVTAYNIGYMRSLNERNQTRYYFCFTTAMFGAVGVALSANILTLFFFYEIISLFTYPLVAHHMNQEARQAGLKYLVYLIGASKLFFLSAMALTYAYAGSLDFRLSEFSGGIFPPETPTAAIMAIYALFLAGFAKAAIIPLHNWLPSAMVAPTPVSALLHAVAVVKVGVFCICRTILNIVGLENMDALHLSAPTAWAAIFTIIAASLIALTKDDLKARLAYSTISQLSYIVLGVALLAPLSVQGGLLHIAAHAFGKITLFMAAGAILVVTGTKSIRLMSGLGRQMPWTFGAFGLACLTMIGVPPAIGFASKWNIALGAAELHQTAIIIALMLSALLNAAYFAPIFFQAFFGQPKETEANHNGKNTAIPGRREAPLSMLLPLCATALISLLLGLYPEIILNFLDQSGWR